MKLIVAIIRPEKWPATRDALQSLGVEDFIHQRVIGRGRQRGLRYLRRAAEGGDGEMPYLPKRMVQCFVADEVAGAVVNSIIKTNQSGNIGDGKIFVCPSSAIEDSDFGEPDHERRPEVVAVERPS